MLRLCKLPSKDGVNNEYGWFDRESGRALTESEVLSMDGTEYRWTAHYADGTTEEAVATFTPGGFLNAGEELVDGAIRELREETSIDVPEGILRNSIKASYVFDTPHRSSRGT
jgi:8-oxo-dGTP pyrophosphatase MutT (NUDIX family)